MRLICLLPVAAIAAMLVGDVAAQEGRRERGQRRVNQNQEEDQAPRGRRATPIMAALDADGDGEISATELENAVAALKKLDENGDGKLAGEEIRPPRGRFGGGGAFGGGGGRGGFDPQAFIDRIFERDEDGDGKLSKDEMPERMAERFAQMDADSDGYLTKKEVEDGFASFRGGRGERREGRGARPRRPQRPE